MQAKYMHQQIVVQNKMNKPFIMAISPIRGFKMIKKIVFFGVSFFFKSPKLKRQIGPNQWEEVPKHEFGYHHIR